MESLDTNCDGVISFHEFIAAGINKETLLTESNLEAVFDIIDTDGNGEITVEDLRTAFNIMLKGETIGPQSDGEFMSCYDCKTIEKSMKEHNFFDIIMAEVDRDSDGKISQTEFFAAMKSLLDIERL